MVTVNPQMRPDCDKILELPVVKAKYKRLFPEDFFYESDP